MPSASLLAYNQRGATGRPGVTPKDRFECRLKIHIAAARQKVNDDFTVYKRMEDGTFILEFVPQRLDVSAAAVMGNGYGAAPMAGDKRLNIDNGGVAEDRVLDMPQGCSPFEGMEVFFGKDFRYQADSLVPPCPLSIMADQTGAFLPPMLQSVKAEIGQPRGVRMAENTADPAFFTHARQNCLMWHGYFFLSAVRGDNTMQDWRCAVLWK